MSYSQAHPWTINREAAKRHLRLDAKEWRRLRAIKYDLSRRPGDRYLYGLGDILREVPVKFESLAALEKHVRCCARAAATRENTKRLRKEKRMEEERRFLNDSYRRETIEQFCERTLARFRAQDEEIARSACRRAQVLDMMDSCRVHIESFLDRIGGDRYFSRMCGTECVLEIMEKDVAHQLIMNERRLHVAFFLGSIGDKECFLDDAEFGAFMESLMGDGGIRCYIMTGMGTFADIFRTSWECIKDGIARSASLYAQMIVNECRQVVATSRIPSHRRIEAERRRHVRKFLRKIRGKDLMNVGEIEAYTLNGEGSFKQFCDTVLERKRVKSEESAKAAVLRLRQEVRQMLWDETLCEKEKNM